MPSACGCGGCALPLTVVERIARPADVNSWPPAVAFARVEASVKGVVGRLTGDQTLIALADLQEAENRQREQAVAKAAEAEATRAEARQKAEAREATLRRQQRAGRGAGRRTRAQGGEREARR